MQEQNPLAPLHHHVAGKADGPWVTFVPGIGNDHTFWQAQADALADTYRTLVFDPWGHGLSPAPPPSCSIDIIVSGIRQMWDALGIHSSHVVGLGFGGSVALALGASAPEIVQRIVACCCRLRQPDDRRDFWRQRQQAASQQGMAAITDTTVDRWLSPTFRAAHPDIDARLRAMMNRSSVAGYQAYVQAFIDMDLESSLPDMQHPTLLIAAEHDHGGGPVPDMQALARQLPQASLLVLPDVGHLCNQEQPNLFNPPLRRFLSTSI